MKTQQLGDYARFRRNFADVMDQRFYTPDWLDGEIAADRAVIFCTERSAIVVAIKEYPTGARELHGLVAVGNLDEIIPLIGQAEAWGREMGCIVACIESREGWARQMRGFGYQPHQMTIRKELV